MTKAKEEKYREVEKKAVEILKANPKIYFFYQLASKLPYSRTYLYDIGISPDKSDIIKTALENNKTDAKSKILEKWENGDNATTQVALYKLLADDDELSRLNNNVDVNLASKNLSIIVGDENTKKEIDEV